MFYPLTLCALQIVLWLSLLWLYVSEPIRNLSVVTTLENEYASVRWICEGAERPDRWMLTIINMTWTVDDLQYHHWIYIIDSRMYSAAEAAVYVANVLISFRGRGAQLSCWVSSIRQNYSFNSMWKVEAAIDFAHLLLITCNSIGLIIPWQDGVDSDRPIPQVNGEARVWPFKIETLQLLPPNLAAHIIGPRVESQNILVFEENRTNGVMRKCLSCYILRHFEMLHNTFSWTPLQVTRNWATLWRFESQNVPKTRQGGLQSPSGSSYFFLLFFSNH